MAYFDRFPVIADYEIGGKIFEMMDITQRTGFVITDNESSYIRYRIEDGETPVILADRIYDNSDLFWVILTFNNIFDIENDWPMDGVSLDRYINRKYDDPYATHHYESLGMNLIVDETHPEYDRIAINNAEYEIQMNDMKRIIKLPVPHAANGIVAEHNRLMQL